MRLHFLAISLLLLLLVAGQVGGANRTHCCMFHRSLNWTVVVNQHRFGVAEYSLRDLLRPDPLKYPDPRNSIVYLGPLGAYGGSRFLAGFALTAFSLAIGATYMTRKPFDRNSSIR